MKPINRHDKSNQRERRELDRLAKERILERYLQAALARTKTTNQIIIDHQPILAQAG